MKKLQMYSLERIDHLLQPYEVEEVTVSSPATEVFTDFKETRPLMIDAGTVAVEAEYEMRRAHVKLKFVVDESLEMVGVVSYQDLSSERVIKMVAEGIGTEEMKVMDLMQPRSALRSLDITDVESATVGDVIHTLRENGEQHCLVIDHQHHHIRGLISASDIARRLRLPVYIEQTPTFASIVNALHH